MQKLSESRAFYAEDLAYVHHVGFSDLARGAGPAILRIMKDAGTTRGLVVELGCGSGVLAKQILQAGYELFGVDASAAMVELAEREAPGGRFVEGSLHEIGLPRCAAIVSVGEGIGYLSGSAAGLDPRPLFGRIAEALSPGGVLVFDVMARSDGEPASYRTWRRGDDWAVLVEVRGGLRGDVLEREITVFRKVGGTYRESTELHRVCLFDAEELQSRLAEVGLESERISGYGDQKLAPGRVGFVARKRMG